MCTVLVRLREPGAQHVLGILTVPTTGSHLSLLPVIREMTSFNKGELTLQAPEECLAFQTTRVWGNGASFGPDKYFPCKHENLSSIPRT